MFDRVEVDATEVPGKIGLVAQGLLPIPSLPNRLSPLPALLAARLAMRE
jgi:hypothetical protein